MTTTAHRVLDGALAYRLWSGPLNRRKWKVMSALADIRPGERVLDLGCGPATNSQAFAHCEYTGIDSNPSYIQTARRVFASGRFEVRDLVREPLGANGEFDLVIINSFLHHLDDEQAGIVLNSLPRILSANGRIVINEPLAAAAPIRYALMKLDRGRHFRSLEGWRHLVLGRFLIQQERTYALEVMPFIVGWHLVAMRLGPADTTLARRA